MKKILSIVLAIAAIFAIAVTANAAAPADLIGEERAYQISLEHAGVAKENVRYSKVELELDDGVYEYDIEFVTNDNIEYDYTVDAKSGNITEFDKERQDSLFDFDFFNIGIIIEWIKNFLANILR